MSNCKDNEIIIHGTTSDGKIFRPSDWAERLCGILSSFNEDNRLSYHEWVSPCLVEKVRCVSISPQLEVIHPAMFHFLMDFASDNDLSVWRDGKKIVQEDLSDDHLISDVHKNESVVSEASVLKSSLREIFPIETVQAFAALSVLRPALNDIHRFVEQVNHMQRAQGYRMFGIFEEGKSNAVAVCGFREETNLASGRHLHIDDLVTIPQYRKRGYAARLLQAVRKVAQEKGIAQIHADSSVSSERVTSHRIYFLHGFSIESHHFVCHVES